jgi:hypothetical protein
MCNMAQSLGACPCNALNAILRHGTETPLFVQPEEEDHPMKTAETIKNDVEQELRWEPSVCATSAFVF